jgi:MFS family permease
MMIGNYYSYDNPAALKSQMQSYFGNPSDFETLYSLLYTVYSVPNVFLPFFGGYFVDRLGVCICLIIFTTLITAGQCVFALGLTIKSWPVMYIGRVIFGFGGESLAVANSAILADWFEGKELAFAFGLNLSIARLGSVINNLVSPAIASGISISFALWFSAFLCGGSLLCAIIMSPIDHSMNVKLGRVVGSSADKDPAGQKLLDEAQNSDVEKDEEDNVKFSEVLNFKFAVWILVISCLVVYGCVLPFNNIANTLLLERNYFIAQPSDCLLTIPDKCESDTNQPNSACHTGNNYQPPLPTTIDSNDVDCTQDQYSDDGTCTYDYCNLESKAQTTAATVMSIPYIISACLSPLLGRVVDNYGKRAYIATLAPILLIIVHLLLAVSSVTPEVPLAGQGISYSAFAAVLWPSVPLVVEKRLVGLAYGVITSVQNLGLATFPLIIAQIYADSDNEYIPNVEYFFVSLACLGTIVGIYLCYYDAQNDNIFNRAKAPEDDDEYDVGLSGAHHISDGPQGRGTSKGSFSVAETQYLAQQKKGQ